MDRVAKVKTFCLQQKLTYISYLLINDGVIVCVFYSFVQTESDQGSPGGKARIIHKESDIITAFAINRVRLYPAEYTVYKDQCIFKLMFFLQNNVNDLFSNFIPA